MFIVTPNGCDLSTLQEWLAIVIFNCMYFDALKNTI